MSYTDKEDWTSDRQKEIDLEIENTTLKTEIELKGGTFGKSDSIDPILENEFLKNVRAFEEAGNESEIPVRSLFPSDYRFPSADNLSAKEIEDKLQYITMIFGQNNIQLDYSEDLPDRILYKHITEQVIPHETICYQTIPGFICHLDGCGGDCESCFQREYCSTAKELDEEEEGGNEVY